MANKTAIKDIVKDPEWQKVRASLVGQWNLRPDWCCSQLKKFLGNISTTDKDNLRIVMNYLTGTGFRIGKIKHPCIIKIRSDISMEMKKRKAKGNW